MGRPGPFSAYAYFTQISYPRDQGYMAHRHTIKELREEQRPFSVIKEHGYSGECNEIRGPTIACVSPVKSKRKVTAFGPKHAQHADRFYKSRGRKPEFWQNLALQDGTKVSPMEVSNYYRTKEVSPMEASNSRCVSPVKSKRKVTAFGPKHAQHADRFYKSRGRKPEFWQNLALQDGTKVSPMEVSNYYGTKEVSPMEVSNYRQTRVEKGHDLPKHPSFTSVNQTSASSGCAKRKVYVPIFQPQETVLKVARISPRPGLGDKFPTIVKKSNDLHETRLAMELKDAPIFQMLCEMTRT